jgi:uncharacterized protein (TIGR03083 family)
VEERSPAVTTATVLERLRVTVVDVDDPGAAAERRARSWEQLLDDWRSVVADAHAHARGLSAEDAEGPTMCDAWTQKDLVAHHIVGDRLTLQAFAGRDGFTFQTLDDGPQRARADEFIDDLRASSYGELLERWWAGFEELYTSALAIEGEDRYGQVPWAAVPISRIALLQARISETWIHGWDGRYPLGATTVLDDRCYWIADLAVRTTIPYGLQKAGHADLRGTARFALDGPAGGEWSRRIGRDDEAPEHLIAGPGWAWLLLASRRWTEHLGWRRDEGIDQRLIGGVLTTTGDGAVLMDAARAFV